MTGAGSSSEAATTSAKARTRGPTVTASEPSGSPNTTIPATIPAALPTIAVTAITGSGPELERAGRGEEGHGTAGERHVRVGRGQQRAETGVGLAAGRLEGDVGEGEEQPGGHAEGDAVPPAPAAQQRGDAEEAEPARECEHRGRCVLRCALAGPHVAGQREQDQPGRGQRHAQPLPAADLEPEDALGDHRHDDDAAREDGLDDRQRHGGQGPGVAQVGQDGQREAVGPPAVTE